MSTVFNGKRVKSVINGAETNYFVGAHYEVTDGVVTKYYYAGAQRIAMRTCTGGTCSAPTYLLGDHLGSTSLTTDATGNVISELRYKAWGEVRYSSGSMPTAYQYTGQYSYASDFGLLFYNARWYDPSLGRFAQADTIVPEQSQGVQAWDRYAYTNNNPVKYTDSTGHLIDPITAILILLGSFFILNGTSDSYQPNLSAEELQSRQASVIVGEALIVTAYSNKSLLVEIAADTYDCANGFCNPSLMIPGSTAGYSEAAEDIRTFYHATNAQGEESILNNGIRLDKGRLKLDFNPANQKGFYVTQDLEQAQAWANRYGEDGRIIQFKVPQTQLDSLNGKIFQQGNNEWLDFVLIGRNGTLNHSYDYVEGPFLRLKDSSPFGHQLAIFTEAAVNLFNKFLDK